MLNHQNFAVGFFEVDINWLVTYWNDEAERLLLMPSKSIIGKDLWKVYEDAVSLRFYSEYHRALNENITIGFQEYYPPRQLWLEVLVSPSTKGLSIYFKDITAHKLSFDRLKLDKSSYFDLFELNPLPQWVYDLNTLAFLYVNKAAIKLYGYTKSEFLKMTIKDIRPNEDHKELENLIKHNRFNSRRVRHHKKDGTFLHVNVKSNPIDLNNIQGRIVVIIDQTDQINAENNLAISEHRFKALVQNGSEMVAILEESGVFKFVIPTTKSILGIHAEVLIGKNVLNFIHPDDLGKIKRQYARFITKKQVKLDAFRFKTKTGQYIWIETIITNMLEDPAVAGIITNSRDVTKRVEADLRNQQSIERYNIVSKATSDAIWDWNVKTGNIIWNKGIKDIFGYKKTTCNLQWWKDNVHPEDLTRILGEFEHFLSHKKSRLKLEYRFRTADGQYKSILDRSFLIFDDHKKPIRMIGCMQDVTEKIAQIRAIEAQNLILKDISWIQAHDLRGPLAKIIGLTNLLEDEKDLSESVCEILKHLMTSTKELDKAIKTILLKIE